MTYLSALPNRRVVEVTGDDRVSFLQGLVSNDVTEAAPGRAVWAALLTPQGKYLADFFIFSDSNQMLLDCAATQAELVVQKLSRLRLRAKVMLHEAPGWQVYAAWSGTPDATATTAPDPRLAEAGWRILSTSALPTNADLTDWNAHRLALGLPDTPDMEPDKTVLLEANFDALHGISWTKGCYMGQELTARTKYRGLLKRRLMPVDLPAPLPPAGTPITDGDREVGTLHEGQGAHAMATLRIDAMTHPLHCAGAPVTVRWPDWMAREP